MKRIYKQVISKVVAEKLLYFIHAVPETPLGRLYFLNRIQSVELRDKMPIIPALRRPRQEGCSQFKASLVYKACSRIAGTTQ